MHQENYQKIHDYLLQNEQQELAGHLDTLWNELQDYQAADEMLEVIERPLDEGEEPDELNRVSAQDFQDSTLEESQKEVEKPEGE